MRSVHWKPFYKDFYGEGGQRARFGRIEAEFRYPDGSYHLQYIDGSNPADALAKAFAWQRRVANPVEVKRLDEAHQSLLKDIAIWGCE